jgi:hypothetical protein
LSFLHDVLLVNVFKFQVNGTAIRLRSASGVVIAEAI